MESLTPYSVLQIDPNTVENEEQLGSKPKFWFRHEGHRWLFKEARPNTGEHWAEKIAAEVAAILHIPSARVELAECQGRKGCAVESFILARRREVLVHGNELLAGSVTGYDMTKRFRQSDHTLTNIIQAVESVFDHGSRRKEAAELLCGYLTLDALIGNTDRHHENWGLILTVMAQDKNTEEVLLRVAPSFDHASSLGRELLDDDRKRKLKENIVLNYVKKGRGGIFGNTNDKHGLSPLEAAKQAQILYPKLFHKWLLNLATLDDLHIHQIVAHVPNEWISPIAREFAATMINIGRAELLNTLPIS
ncbi:hypothetical protein GCM10023213_43540 [Prosthecobacter algae]|uniref:HipA-like C-terminal domain-containing protein n=1 Tax=Prosthecobacter algae TaxID=1144682 RepID=A0ABP9PNG1_9BACT